MRNYPSIAILILIFTFISGCTTVQEKKLPPTAKPKITAEVNQTVEQNVTKPKQEILNISPEVAELLNKSKTKVTSINYIYKGPETGNDFYVFYTKGVKVKYLPSRIGTILDRPDSVDSIFIDVSLKTAQTYCMDRRCIFKGKKGDLNFYDAYILTICDWLRGITDAKKIGEEVIDDRNVWKIETNRGIFWIDTYYGIPLKIESNGNVYRFQQIAVNSVQDSDVVPS